MNIMVLLDDIASGCIHTPQQIGFVLIMSC